MSKNDHPWKQIIVETHFVRKGLTALTEKEDVPLGWFALSWRLVGCNQFKDARHDAKQCDNCKRARRRLHGSWCEISCGKRSTLRVLRFAGGLRSAEQQPKDIVVDYLAWLQLSDYEADVSAPAKLSIRTIHWYQYPRVVLSHPDPSFRVANALALLSLILGVISMIMAIGALFKV